MYKSPCKKNRPSVNQSHNGLLRTPRLSLSNPPRKISSTSTPSRWHVLFSPPLNFCFQIPLKSQRLGQISTFRNPISCEHLHESSCSLQVGSPFLPEKFNVVIRACVKLHCNFASNRDKAIDLWVSSLMGTLIISLLNTHFDLDNMGAFGGEFYSKMALFPRLFTLSVSSLLLALLRFFSKFFLRVRYSNSHLGFVVLMFLDEFSAGFCKSDTFLLIQ